jgi:3-isopropylmalate/(R)-2-methylmalate dehydratase large subunit
MPGKTIIEKILQNHTTSSRDIKADDIIICEIDLLLAQDGTAPLAINAFNKLNTKIPFPERINFIIDHNSPAPNEGVSNLHKLMREFAQKYSINLYDIGEGICHQVMIESKKLSPGMLVVGADSHTITYGALNLAAIGIGSTELAACMATSKLWFKVPKTKKIIINGKPKNYVFSKDIALYLLRILKEEFANYRCIEYQGEYINSLSIESRFTLANMSAELGAKACIMPFDDKLKDYYKEGIHPDEDAEYEEIREFRIDELEPQVALPHAPSNVVDIQEVVGLKVDQVIIGTCTNGRLEDLEIVHKIIKNRKVNKDTRLIVIPASKHILKTCITKGIIEDIISAGGVIFPPGCGPCVGTHGGIPADDEVILSTANRNFKGRMGNPKARIYLVSPATASASAITGKITHPKEFLS